MRRQTQQPSSPLPARRRRGAAPLCWALLLGVGGSGLPAVGHAAEESLASWAATITSGESLWLGLLIAGCVVVLAGTDWLLRRMRLSLQRRKRGHQKPGQSPLAPLRVQSYDEVFRRRTATCRCGERPKVVFEGATRSEQRKLWLAIEICPCCQQRYQTYFDVTDASDAQPVGGHTPATPVPR